MLAVLPAVQRPHLLPYGPRGHRLRAAERRHLNQRLMGETAIKQLVALGATELVIRSTLKNDRDVRSVLLGEGTVLSWALYPASSSPLNRRR